MIILPSEDSIRDLYDGLSRFFDEHQINAVKEMSCARRLCVIEFEDSSMIVAVTLSEAHLHLRAIRYHRLLCDSRVMREHEHEVACLAHHRITNYYHGRGENVRIFASEYELCNMHFFDDNASDNDTSSVELDNFLQEFKITDEASRG